MNDPDIHHDSGQEDAGEKITPTNTALFYDYRGRKRDCKGIFGFGAEEVWGNTVEIRVKKRINHEATTGTKLRGEG
jgi:hypothetical protein